MRFSELLTGLAVAGVLILAMVMLVCVGAAGASAGTDLIFDKYRSTTCVTNEGITVCS